MPDPATMIVLAIINAKGHYLPGGSRMMSMELCEKVGKEQVEYYKIQFIDARYECRVLPYKPPPPPEGRSMGGIEGTQFDRNSNLFKSPLSSPSAPK